MRRRCVWPRVVLVVVALVVGTACVYGGWLPHPAASLAPVGAAGLAAAFVYGLGRAAGAGPVDRFAAGCLWGAAYLVVLPVPAAVRLAGVWREASRLGALPDAKIVWVRVDPVRYDDRRDFDVLLSTPRAGGEVCEALTRNSARLGWRVHETVGEAEPCDNPILGSARWRRVGDGLYGDVLVTGFDAQREGETRVHVFLLGDEPPQDLKGLRGRLP